jgi:hypothetical protein
MGVTGVPSPPDSDCSYSPRGGLPWPWLTMLNIRRLILYLDSRHSEILPTPTFARLCHWIAEEKKKRQRKFIRVPWAASSKVILTRRLRLPLATSLPQ